MSPEAGNDPQPLDMSSSGASPRYTASSTRAADSVLGLARLERLLLEMRRERSCREERPDDAALAVAAAGDDTGAETPAKTGSFVTTDDDEFEGLHLTAFTGQATSLRKPGVRYGASEADARKHPSA